MEGCGGEWLVNEIVWKRSYGYGGNQKHSRWRAALATISWRWRRIENEQEDLEETLDKLNNIEDIKANLSESLSISTIDEIGIQNSLQTLQNRLQKIASFSNLTHEPMPLKTPSFLW